MRHSSLAALHALAALWALLLLCPGLATAEEAPRPEPWLFTHPLRAEALFASGYAAPWLSATSAWVSRDGKRVAFFTHEPASAEGISRTLVVKEVDTDAVVFEKALFSEQESLQWGSALTRLARARAAEALTSLAADPWLPMTHQELPAHEREFFSDACFEKQLHPRRSVSVDELRITYQEPRTQVWRRGKKVLDRRAPSWRVHQERSPHASPSWLNRVFVHRESGVVLLELAFCGVDLHPEPAPVLHALRIPGGKPRTEPPPMPPTIPGPPTVHYETGEDITRTLYVTGFPALHEFSSRVVIAEVLPDGERGAPNLHLALLAPHNEVLWRLTLLDAEESASVAKAPPARRQELDKTVLERIRLANARLQGVEWEPLEERLASPIARERCPLESDQAVNSDDLHLTFHQGEVIWTRGGSRYILEVTLPASASPASASCGTERRTFLDTVYANPRQTTVVLHLGTCVDDRCPEPRQGYHLLHPPPPPPAGP